VFTAHSELFLVHQYKKTTVAETHAVENRPKQPIR
jgi:hypothetical protein